jgi:hypothetical protein
MIAALLPSPVRLSENSAELTVEIDNWPAPALAAMQASPKSA